MTLKISERDHAFVLGLGRKFGGRSAGYNAAALMGSMILQGKFPPTTMSSVVEALRYFPESQTLGVRFGSGEEYRYFEVPQSVADDFVSAESKGQFFTERVRPKFRCELVSSDQPALL